jgi:phenylalanyl-tRNA synthetase beta chain
VNFSYQWLSELVEGLDTGAARLGQLITLKTAECEGVHPVAAHLERVSAARVQSVEPIPGSEHNVKAVVETGRYGVKTVVCGAPNCRPGMVTAYVPSGTTLGDGRAIGIAVVNGVESDGMLASGAELGLNRDAKGILELEQEPGTRLKGCLPDAVIEIDNKSLTHRPDLWGHYGMAREVAAITRRRLKDPARMELMPAAEAGPAPVKVAIENFELCPRYSALVFENVTVGPSPLWLQYRLEAVGLNPINNIVDVTNFVMAELAQPMHAFDAAKLREDTIFVRAARAGESLVALNEERYELKPSNMVIADAGGPIAIAGVIGGLDSGITESTTRLVLESANFQATSIRRTSVALKLRTDASMRFEKAQDPVNTLRGLARAAELLAVVSPGIKLVGGLADSYRPAPAPAPIALPLDWLGRKLGTAVTDQQVVDILESLEFGVSRSAEQPGVLSVAVPSWRATKDIAIKDDLVEEIGRVIGYDAITPVAPMVPCRVPPSNPERAFHHQLRDMVAAQGFVEVYNYSFVSEESARAFGFEPAQHLTVSNPIASNQTLLRMSLLPNIWRNIQENSKHFDEFRLFEIGREIHQREGRLPEEIPHLVAAKYTRNGAADAGAAGLFELKRLAECLMSESSVQPDAAPRPFEHPARAARVIWRGATVGRLFELHPKLVESGRAAILDLNLAMIEMLDIREKRYQSLRRFPSSAFDLSVVARARDLAGDIQQLLVKYAKGDLEQIEFVRQYSGPPLAEGQKSVSFRLTVAALDHTLSSEEVGAIRSRIIEGMRSEGFELRV